MKKYITIIILAFLVGLAFLLRVGSFEINRQLTNDEYIYSALADQLSQNPPSYNIIGLYVAMSKKGIKPPSYFKKPLFKHPYLFPFLISRSYKIFGRRFYAAFLVSLFFGISLIPLTYLLGSTLFDDKIGIYSATLMSIEPINWICSQKIWMETTLAFFIVLSLYFFARAIKKYNPFFIILSGVSAGLAVLTKYPGILAMLIIFVYALCCERWLFKKKVFIVSLFIPFVMLAPWGYWNCKIYGLRFITDISIVHNVLYRLSWSAQKYLSIVGFFLLAAGLLFCFIKHGEIRTISALALFLVLFFILRKNIMNGLNLTYIPRTGWTMGMFSKEPWHFYLGRLLEFSPFYMFSFLGLLLFIFDRNHFKECLFLCLSTFIIFAFYIWWRNYQSRYILSSIAPLLILSAKTQSYILESLEGMPPRFFVLRIVMVVSFVLVILFALCKTLHVNSILALPNLACYF